MAAERRNTHRLPRGEPIRRALKVAFRAQRARVLAALGVGRKDDQVGPVDLPDLTGDTPAMAEPMAPRLALYWDQGGRALRARVGLDPDRWDVTNPHTASMISKAAFDFCAATNATTSRALADARAKLAEELTQGIVSQGEALPSLVKRVNRVFDQAETYRARRIAASEASRAVHAAQEEAARESGVVDGFEWLLSDDACPLCHKVADEAPRVRLGQAFAIIGDHPTYSQVRFPPLHPNDQCTVIEILKPEYGGPESVEWSQTLVQPQVGDEPAPPPPAKPVEPKPAREPEPKPAPVPGEPVAPGKPIARRIAKWEGAKERLAALGTIDRSEVDRAEAEMRAVVKRVRPFLAPDGRPRRDLTPTQAIEAGTLLAEYEALASRRIRALDHVRALVARAIRLPEGSEGLAIEASGGYGEPTQARFDAASAFLSGVCRPVGATVKVVARPLGGDGRAYYSTRTAELGAGPDSLVQVLAHELMHAIEHQAPAIAARVEEFLKYRVGREEPQSLAELFPGHGYRPSETGRKDRFDRHFSARDAYYVGKDYKGDGSEVLSMGVEALLKDPAGFAKNDPEYCKFVLGILSGELR